MQSAEYVNEKIINTTEETKMQIRLATQNDFSAITKIVRKTILEIYPHYYPKGAVEYFLNLHSDEAIFADIEGGMSFCAEGNSAQVVGTVTIRENEICRLFVLPQFQRRRFGTALLDFAENAILQNHAEVKIDASLPAKPLYLKRGYKEIEFYSIENKGDFLCYDVMRKIGTNGENL